MSVSTNIGSRLTRVMMIIMMMTRIQCDNFVVIHQDSDFFLFEVIYSVTRGGSHIDMVYVCACLLGRFFAKFGIAIGGFHQGQRSPNYINWVYFGQIIVRGIQIGQNWVLFFRKW